MTLIELVVAISAGLVLFRTTGAASLLGRPDLRPGRWMWRPALFAAGMLTESLLAGEPDGCLILLLCAAPAFGWGLIEDFSKRGAFVHGDPLSASGSATS